MLKFSIRNLFISQILISTISLSLMYIIEFVWNYEPCHLCLYERYPYFIIIIISIFGYLLNKKPMLSKWLILFCTITWLSSSILAFYHTGVEHSLFETTSCKNDNNHIISSVEEMRKFIVETKSIDCKNPEFKILNWSLAELNLIFSSLIFIIMTYNFSFLIRRRNYEK